MSELVMDRQTSGGVEAMQKWGYVALHAAVAATFIFLLQRFALEASFDSSVLWAVVFGLCAAFLAYNQTKR